MCKKSEQINLTAPIDLMHRRHHAAMLGVKAIALYAIVISDKQLLLRVILLTPKRGRHEIMMSLCVRSIKLSTLKSKWIEK